MWGYLAVITAFCFAKSAGRMVADTKFDLVTNPGRLITQKHLLREVWGMSRSNKSNYLRVYMAQLRRKLEADPAHPRYLITEPGMGYRFEG